VAYEVTLVDITEQQTVVVADGPHDEDPARLRTDVYWLLSAP
jgi:hypothetical protein